MSLASFIKKQFIDILQWTEDTEGVLSWRYPMEDLEIQNGGTLVVRESQMAVFVNEGQVADVFGPGTYKLTTQTLPVLTYLRNWDKLFQSPFKSDVYFFSTRVQTGRRWGTQQPITIRDADFGMVRLRAFGLYSYRVADAKVFHKELSGTRAYLHARRRRGAAARHHPRDDGQLDRRVEGQLPRHGREPDADGEPGQGRPRGRARALRPRARRIQRAVGVAAGRPAGSARQADLDGHGRRPEQVHAVPDRERDPARSTERRRHRRHRRRARVGHGDRPADGAGLGERHERLERHEQLDDAADDGRRVRCAKRRRRGSRSSRACWTRASSRRATSTARRRK